MAVVEAAGNRIVKVIVEVGYLTDVEIIKACELAKEAAANRIVLALELI